MALHSGRAGVLRQVVNVRACVCVCLPACVHTCVLAFNCALPSPECLFFSLAPLDFIARVWFVFACLLFACTWLVGGWWLVVCRVCLACVFDYSVVWLIDLVLLFVISFYISVHIFGGNVYPLCWAYFPSILVWIFIYARARMHLYISMYVCMFAFYAR